MSELESLWQIIEGEGYGNETFRLLYATDASEYREIPMGVVYPKNNHDVALIVQWAAQHRIPIIPRAGGTSLAGQVVGNGLVVDVSKYLTQFYDLDPKNHTVWVQAGVVRDDLNQWLQKEQLFFAPETSTSNRACIGGMFGNNSCGGNSLLYGSTRDHVLEAKGFLSDGSFVHFKELSSSELQIVLNANTYESKLYRSVLDLLQPQEIRNEIVKQFPDKKIRRRNSGYAIDELMTEPINFCKLLAGSEGTLAFITDLKLNLTPIQKLHKGVIAVHCDSVDEVLRGNLIALDLKPSAVELIDNQIIQLSLQNSSQKENISVLNTEEEGRAIHILAIEFSESDTTILHQKCDDCIKALQNQQIGYSFPILFGADVTKIWQIRKSGLGIMSNMKGSAKPKSFVEDSVVLPEKLPSYYAEFDSLCKENGLQMVSYGHISTGEIHKKPVLDFHNPKHVELFHELALQDALLVKKYGGCLSGEHGDGRLRAEFLPLMLGETIYQTFIQLKNIFDLHRILNPGKIVEAPGMDQNLRESPQDQPITIPSFYDFPETDGFVNALKKCCNSGDCRKSAQQTGTMCPSYQAMNEEYYSTRARANLLREMILNSSEGNPYVSRLSKKETSDFKYIDQEIYEILSWCLSCKACKAECPSQVDITKLKAEFLQQYYTRHRIPFRSWIIGNYPEFNQLGVHFSSIYNFVITQKTVSKWFKKGVGFAVDRSLPKIQSCTLLKWHQKRKDKPTFDRKVYLFPDEFTNFNDVKIGKKAILLLEHIGYQVEMIPSAFSGRTYLSKGMLKSARKCAQNNIKIYNNYIDYNTPLLGIEPSAILSFRDEYPDLLQGELKQIALQLKPHCLLIDEFIVREFENGNISEALFTEKSQKILFHAHCYQKALSDKTISVKMMQIPKNYSVELIEDGCCGMAGSFGFEKEHYELSQKVGNLKLFPAIQNREENTIISACGTSCRHQIKDGTHEPSFHPIEILFNALLC